jgi:hypothetical protein
MLPAVTYIEAILALPVLVRRALPRLVLEREGFYVGPEDTAITG